MYAAFDKLYVCGIFRSAYENTASQLVFVRNLLTFNVYNKPPPLMLLLFVAYR